MPETELGGEAVSYAVRYSGRARYPRIDVTLSGVEVVVPEDMDLDPESFLLEKQDWVLEKDAELAPVRDEIPERQFVDGATFPVEDEEHMVCVTGVSDHVIRDGLILLARDRVTASSIRDELEELLRETARDRVHTIIDRYRLRIDGEPNTVYIRNQQTRWGSCSAKDNLSFNWRLIMAPPRIMEYIVVHELVHLEHHDHSDRFWDRLTELCPHAAESRDWLEANGHRLIFSDDDIV
jgi:predicted metal-dependent hydrolase